MPSYLELYRSGELDDRATRARVMLDSCHLCPHRCRVDRLIGEVGKCRTAAEAVVSSYGPHFGEEAPLVGTRGSGTIFFANCNLRCVFCQNYNISQSGEGEAVTSQALAGMMLALQSRGCHNINFVTPTHVVPQILSALLIAVDEGLSIPLVYNCGGYESVETLKLLDGVIDIYMPDMKCSDERNARELSGVDDYPEANRKAVKEMHRQVGALRLDDRGIATRGLLVRHLVLPNGIADTKGIVEFIAKEISKDTYLNIMDQYRPAYRAYEIPRIARPLHREEYLEAVNIAAEHGLERLDGVSRRSFVK
ncbi:MAG: radical SAM protein [Chloroflexota bacterium]|nr:radical SAM protein [Chloroflexota bacterium]